MPRLDVIGWSDLALAARSTVSLLTEAFNFAVSVGIGSTCRRETAT